MCGFYGVAALAGRSPSVGEQEAVRLRDMLSHRGPDGAGLWAHQNVVLGHRRLAVIDPTEAGAQPMRSADGRFVIVYNGELYNDAVLRRELQARGVALRTRCDTETVLEAFACWGLDALPRLRGMFAFAIYDLVLDTLTLARDPLGVKPLYFHADEHEIVFASEPAPILASPNVSARPNMAMASAYLTTIRTVLGNDTLFEGVYALAPGQLAQCDLGASSPTMRLLDYWSGPPVGDDDISLHEAARFVRARVQDSIGLHLRSDVPTCALLSGGLDSAIVAAIAASRAHDLRTYCAGARGVPADAAVEGLDPAALSGDDFEFARLCAERFNTRHAEAPITRERFSADWPDMIRRMGVPLSTPNEVAIHAVASALRADGCIVTLSGEGADELFAGYEGPLASAAAHVRAVGGASFADPIAAGGVFELLSNAWITPDAKPAILNDAVWRSLDEDASLIRLYEHEFERCARESRGSPTDTLDAHLRFHRRVNLTGLLQRLDTATMLAGVEGRTPFADAVVATLAESLPISLKFDADAEPSGAAGVATAVRTKLVLREAFRDVVPAAVLERPKASFPLPFQSWAADLAPRLRESAFAREVYTEAAIEMVAAEPVRLWRFAWPMINLALWGDRWW